MDKQIVMDAARAASRARAYLTAAEILQEYNIHACVICFATDVNLMRSDRFPAPLCVACVFFTALAWG